MKALVFERNLPRFAASRVASMLGSGRGAKIGPLELLDTDPPDLPDGDWFRLRPRLAGICGSDLALIDGRSSRYFDDMVSFPFVPGHEVVGDLDLGGIDHAGTILDPGTRAVIEPALGCAPRQIDPPCPQCGSGQTGLCEHVAFGRLSPGLQTGYCTDTGGGWSAAGLVAHSSQIHTVPERFSDEDAMMVEPAACAAHAVLSGGVRPGDAVAVIGAGTLGLVTVAALHHLIRTDTPCTVLVGAKYPHQRRMAEALGADTVVPPAQLVRAIRRETASLVLAGRLTGGADLVFDCVGSPSSLTQALNMVRPRGRVVLVGMPSKMTIDLAALWHRELTLVGAYAYGVEPPATTGGPPRRTFELAIELVDQAQLGSLVSATYPIERYEEAISHAGAAGPRGAVKVAFDLRNRKGRTR